MYETASSKSKIMAEGTREIDSAVLHAAASSYHSKHSRATSREHLEGLDCPVNLDVTPSMSHVQSSALAASRLLGVPCTPPNVTNMVSATARTSQIPRWHRFANTQANESPSRARTTALCPDEKAASTSIFNHGQLGAASKLGRQYKNHFAGAMDPAMAGLRRSLEKVQRPPQCKMRTEKDNSKEHASTIRRTPN
jgi:hypothetical protein